MVDLLPPCGKDASNCNHYVLRGVFPGYNKSTHLERPMPHVVLNRLVIEPAPDEPLTIEHGVAGVHRNLPSCRWATGK